MHRMPASCWEKNPRAMRDATISDGSFAVAEPSDPEPGKGELLVRVRAAGLNGADIHQRAGGYPAPPGSPPDIPGRARAGEVVAAGPAVRPWKAGAGGWASLAAAVQAELAVVQGRAAMPAAD